EVDVELVDGGEVVVAGRDGGLELVAHEVDALDRVGAVADQVADGDVLLHALLFHLVEDGLERFKVGVDVAENSVFHGSANFPLAEERTGYEKHRDHVERRIDERQHQIPERNDLTLAEIHLQVKVPEVRNQIRAHSSEEG